MSLVDDCCLVCAEPLEWTAVGPCGHKETCSRCVARLRFVLKDKRCVLCQQDVPAVFFTRYMGDFTDRPPAEDFDGLKKRADRGELRFVPEVDGYFNDEQHYQEIRSLCGYTHPVVTAKAQQEGGRIPTFDNFNALKRHVDHVHKLSFCDICLSGRKVFICEQQLYTRSELDRHNKQGDETGPLAESGFKGHPPCKFCRQRFYDSNELYKHMEAQHEHCFICRRQHPDKYVYYRHYKELEDHFNKDHHLCPHPHCLEARFVVFTTDAELKRHFAQEHGEQMSRAQRREALTIPIQLQYRDRHQEEPPPDIPAQLLREGVVIGGGHNVTGRHGARGRGGGQQQQQGLRHSRSEPQMVAETVQASYATAQAEASAREQDGGENVSEVTFQVMDFPYLQSGAPALGPMGRWAAYAAGGRSSGPVDDSQFPALPSRSKASKKRLKDMQNKTLAQHLAAAGAAPRVINRASPGGASGSNAAAVPGAYWPELSRSGSTPSLSAAAAQAPTPAPAPAAPAVVSSSAAPLAASSSAGPTVAAKVAPPPKPQPPASLVNEEFPSLGGASSSGSSSMATAFLPKSYAAKSSGKGASSSGAAPASSTPTKPPIRAEDFPSLGQVAVAAARSSQAPAAASATASSSSAPSVAAAAASAVRPGGVSDELKAANKALVEKIKRQLSASAFETFRGESGQFARGEISAEEFHDNIVSLNLLPVAAEIASLLPHTDKRLQLMAAHKAYLASPAAAQGFARAAGAAGWMPPEAAVAAANKAEQCASWSCALCTLINAPTASHCEACRAPKQSTSSTTGATTSSSSGAYSSRNSAPAPTPAEDFPSLPSSSGDDGGASGSKKKGKGKTINITNHRSQQQQSQGQVNPRNVWTQPQFLKKQAEQAKQQLQQQQQQGAKGQWAAAGKLANGLSAVNAAWAKQ